MTRPNGTYLPDHLEDPLPVNVPSRLSRRRLLQRGAALGISLPAIGWLLAACGGDDSDDDDGGNESAASPTAASSESTSASTSESGGGTAQNGGRLTVIQTGSIPDLDPQSAYDSDASAIFFGTYEMLVRLKGSDTFEYEPMLAESWEGNDDNTEWRFKIPAGVKFHDGTDCDAEAVAASFKRFHNMGLGPVNVITRFVASADDISAEDATTVLFKLSFGTEIFVAALASQYGPLVVSPAAVEANKTADDEFAHEWFRSNVVGTGPYTITENVLGDHITMVRFEDYHGGWDGNHFMRSSSATSRNPPPAVSSWSAARLTARPNRSPRRMSPPSQEAGVLNVMVYDLDERRLGTDEPRQARGREARQGNPLGVPHDDVRKGVYGDLIEASSGACTTTTRGYPEDGFIYTTDLDKAKQLIDESGFDVSQPLEF
ncbi:MAG: ABC transporter substrate-binding protein [Thermomicrobiales bacterium]|nr:ABC transporter substrate-binding protein [Thermomicrobiales bacterium]